MNSDSELLPVAFCIIMTIVTDNRHARLQWFSPIRIINKSPTILTLLNYSRLHAVYCLDYSN